MQKLDQLLSSPDGMKRIQDMMAAFGVSAPSPSEPPPPVQETFAAPDLSSLLTGGDTGMLLKLLPLLSDLGREDDTTALLHALRPHLKDDRRKRLDDAGQMLKLIKLMPLLGELGKGGESS